MLTSRLPRDLKQTMFASTNVDRAFQLLVYLLAREHAAAGADHLAFIDRSVVKETLVAAATGVFSF